MTESREYAVGVKLYIGEGLIEDYDLNEFLKNASCEFYGVDEFDGNPLIAKYYDEDSGIIYFHFKEKVPTDVVSILFEEDEIIPELIG